MLDPTIARGNALLDRLSVADLEHLLPDLTSVDLVPGAVLEQPGRTSTRVTFPLAGVVSLVVPLGRSEVVEAATVGHEGLVGLSLFLGGAPTERATVRVAGHGLVMSAEDFTEQIRILDGPFERVLRRHARLMFAQLARNAACNLAHTVRQRAARWLLMTAERMPEDSFDLTQEYLAQMLTARRASVNQVARALSREGCISYQRGKIRVLDKGKLRANACECYPADLELAA